MVEKPLSVFCQIFDHKNKLSLRNNAVCVCIKAISAFLFDRKKGERPFRHYANCISDVIQIHVTEKVCYFSESIIFGFSSFESTVFEIHRKSSHVYKISSEASNSLINLASLTKIEMRLFEVVFKPLCVPK